MKTLAIRLEDDTHAQLSMLAQLEELTVTDAIRQAIDSYIEAKRSQPELRNGPKQCSRILTVTQLPGARPLPPSSREIGPR